MGQRWLAGAVVAVGLAPRLLGLDRKSVWFDEVVTWLDAHEPWARLADALRSDVHPPLSYVLYHLWPFVDGGDFWLRLPSAVLGAIAVGVAYVWARRIGTPAQAVLTSGFVALSSLQIDLAQEARMYSLLLLLTALSLLLLDRLVVCPGRANATLYAVCACALLYTHYYGAFVLAAQALASLAPRRRATASQDFAQDAANRWWVVASLAVAGVSFVPWLPVLVGQAGGIQGDYWIERPTLTTLWVTFRDLVAHTPPDEPFRVVLRVAYVVQAGLLAVGAIKAAQNARQWNALTLALVPIALALGISVLVAPVYAVRYVSVVGLAVGFLLARGITALPRGVNVVAGVVAFVPVMLSLPLLYTDPGYSRADLRSAARAVQAERQADEVVLHLGAFTALPFDYYGVAQPAAVLQTNDRNELCDALRGHSGGWLVSAYAADDQDARAAAEAGITAEAYAGTLISQPATRFLGVTAFHVRAPC